MSYGHEMVSGKEKNWTRQLKRCSNFYRIQLKLYGSQCHIMSTQFKKQDVQKGIQKIDFSLNL